MYGTEYGCSEEVAKLLYDRYGNSSYRLLTISLAFR